MLSVVTPATSTSLTTLQAVKAELAITNSADDAWLSDAINRASATAARYCNRVFGTETVQETYRVRLDDDGLLLTRWPVASIVSVLEDPANTPTPLVSGTDFEADLSMGMVFRLDGNDNRTNWKQAKVVIQYQAGFALPGQQGANLPADVEQTVILLVKDAWFRRASDPNVKSEEVFGVGRTDYWVGPKSDDDLPPEVTGRLNKYRMPAMG